MSEAELGSGLERIRANHRHLMEVVGVAVGLSFFVNITATCVTNLLSGADHPGLWIAIFSVSVGILFAGTVVLEAVLSAVNEFGDIALTLGVLVNSGRNDVEILGLADYQPAEIARELFARVRGTFAADFAKEWPGANPIRHEDFKSGHLCRDALDEMVQALIIVLLSKYGEHSLTHSALFYGEFRRIAGRIPAEGITRQEWPESIQSNRFLTARGIAKLLLPKSTQLQGPSVTQSSGNKPRPSEIALVTGFGTLTFSISPYWTILSNRERALAEFGVSESENLTFLRIPIDLKLNIGGIGRLSYRIRSARKNMTLRYLFSHDRMTLQYLWFQGLVENTRRRMDWGLHLKSRAGLDHDP